PAPSNSTQRTHAPNKNFYSNYAALLVYVSYAEPPTSSSMDDSPSQRLPDPDSSTKYPKITNKPSEILEALALHYPSLPPLIPLTGTTKLHGTHADILISASDTITLQSRNVLALTPSNDNCSFAASMAPLTPHLLRLKTQYHARYASLHPTEPLSAALPLIIAGEWIGPGVQKGVAVSRLPTKALVIISACVNGAWVRDEEYADICDEEAGIYNISRGGFFHGVLDTRDVEASMRELRTLTDRVEEACPFAAALGVAGKGEGVVWKAADPFPASPEFWLKVKGKSFAVSDLEGVQKKVIGTEGRERARVWAEGLVTERRLEQGWEVMGEMGLGRGR
ncbi:hypothetical protein MMC13_001863, partial [Lambiella insularis]|nr:hypothetical protein [Lambiella insularis]